MHTENVLHFWDTGGYWGNSMARHNCRHTKKKSDKINRESCVGCAFCARQMSYLRRLKVNKTKKELRSDNNDYDK